MRKYISIYRSEIMSSLQYILNILFRIFNFVLIIFVFINLWEYIYDDPSELINGYSKNQMIWYVIMTEIIWYAVDGRRYCRKISNDVKSGNIAYIMNKPYSYIGYAFSSHLGETTIKTIIAMVVGFGMGILLLKGFPVPNVMFAVITAVSVLLAILIDMLFVTFIGLISFVIEDSQPIFWLYSKLILILGVVFPIEYFPEAIAKIIRFTPIYVTSYGPAKLFVDFSYEKAVEIILSQIIYLGIAWAMCYGLYRKGVKKLNVTGG